MVSDCAIVYGGAQTDSRTCMHVSHIAYLLEDAHHHVLRPRGVEEGAHDVEGRAHAQRLADGGHFLCCGIGGMDGRVGRHFLDPFVVFKE